MDLSKACASPPCHPALKVSQELVRMRPYLVLSHWQERIFVPSRALQIWPHWEGWTPLRHPRWLAAVALLGVRPKANIMIRQKHPPGWLRVLIRLWGHAKTCEWLQLGRPEAAHCTVVHADFLRIGVDPRLPAAPILPHERIRHRGGTGPRILPVVLLFESGVRVSLEARCGSSF